MMPAIVVVIPIFLMFRVIGLAGTYTGIIFLYTAFNLPFTIWMVKSFFDELNREIEDAARMDGANERKVFFGICLPQVKAGLAATGSPTWPRLPEGISTFWQCCATRRTRRRRSRRSPRHIRKRNSPPTPSSQRTR